MEYCVFIHTNHKKELFGEYALLGRYKSHPDPNQERFFFGLLKNVWKKVLSLTT